MPIRFLAVPALASVVVAFVGWLYARRLAQESLWQRSAERDPLGPSEDVELALGRATVMKVSTEAEALASIGNVDR